MQVNILEAKNRLSQLIKSAQAGEEVIIANRGVPVVRLVPAEKPAETEPPIGSAERILDWLAKHPAPEYNRRSAAEINAAIEEERDFLGVIYLNSCMLIYLIEGEARWKDEVARAMAAAAAPFCISAMVKCECLVGPSRDADLRLRQRYWTLFDQFTSLPLPEAVYLQAAELRGRYRLRTPDALHLACAQHHGCDALWTNDARLERASGGLSHSLDLRD